MDRLAFNPGACHGACLTHQGVSAYLTHRKFILTICFEKCPVISGITAFKDGIGYPFSYHTFQSVQNKRKAKIRNTPATGFPLQLNADILSY